MDSNIFDYLDSLKKEPDLAEHMMVDEVESYFNKFFEKYNYNDLDNLDNLSSLEASTAIFILDCPYRIKEIIAIMNKYAKILSKNHNLDLLPNFHHYYNDAEYRHWVDCFLKAGIIDSLILIREMYDTYDEFYFKITLDFVNFIRCYPSALEDFNFLVDLKMEDYN